MAESPDRGRQPQPGHGEWPAWLDEDDFDGLGEDAWRAAMESLAEEGPTPADEPSLAELPDDPDDGGLAGSADCADCAGGDPGDDQPRDDGPRDDGPWDESCGGGPCDDGPCDDGPCDGACGDDPVLGFGPGESGESMPPGVSLGMLAEHYVVGGGLGVMSDDEVIGLVGAARRLRCRAEWLELQGTREFARRRWESDVVPVRDTDGRWLFKNSAAEQAADELAFHLGDSRAQAGERMELSLALRDRLPRMDALQAAGRLDERRVQAVADITAGLSQELARRVDELLAPDAPGLLYAALRRRAAKLAMSLSPESERKRKEKATRRKARVEKFLEKSGNYALAVREMPVEEILASEQHIRDLASYLRRHGVKLGQREAEVLVYLDLTQGRDPLDRIPPARRDHARPGPAPRGESSLGGSAGGSGDDDPCQSSSSSGAGDSGRWQGSGGDDPRAGSGNGSSASASAGGSGDGSGDGSQRRDGDADGPRQAGGHGSRDRRDGHGQHGGDGRHGEGRRDEGRQDDEAWRDGPWDDYDEDDEDDEDGDDGDDGGSGGGNGGGGGPGPWPFSPPGPGRPSGRAPFAATVNLLVPAGTAFGWSTMPGEAGRDIIDPRTLRDMMQAASRHPATRWCVTFVGADGTAVAHGCARGRHTWDPPPSTDGNTGTTTTRTTSPAGPGRQPAPAQAAALAEFLARLKVTVELIAKGTCDHQHDEPRYRPSKRLGHLIRARNATCPAPGCEASSYYCDLDHTEPWPDGPTDECNIGPPCRHHHRTKQAPGWKLEQPAPGVFRWTTPSGRIYQTRPTRYDM